MVGGERGCKRGLQRGAGALALATVTVSTKVVLQVTFFVFCSGDKSVCYSRTVAILGTHTVTGDNASVVNGTCPVCFTA